MIEALIGFGIPAVVGLCARRIRVDKLFLFAASAFFALFITVGLLPFTVKQLTGFFGVDQFWIFAAAFSGMMFLMTIVVNTALVMMLPPVEKVRYPEAVTKVLQFLFGYAGALILTSCLLLGLSSLIFFDKPTSANMRKTGNLVILNILNTMHHDGELAQEQNHWLVRYPEWLHDSRGEEDLNLLFGLSISFAGTDPEAEPAESPKEKEAGNEEVSEENTEEKNAEEERTGSKKYKGKKSGKKTSETREKPDELTIKSLRKHVKELTEE